MWALQEGVEEEEEEGGPKVVEEEVEVVEEVMGPRHHLYEQTPAQLGDQQLRLPPQRLPQLR